MSDGTTLIQGVSATEYTKRKGIINVAYVHKWKMVFTCLLDRKRTLLYNLRELYWIS